jgi:hypothetical protein
MIRKALAWLILVAATGATIGGFVKWFIEDPDSFIIFLEGIGIVAAWLVVVWAVFEVSND